jgi:hypothetical protein
LLLILLGSALGCRIARLKSTGGWAQAFPK